MGGGENHENLSPGVPENEEDRLAELRSLRVLDTAAEERFDRITRLIAELFDFPMAIVSLIDRNRQWIKSSRKFEIRECRREISFCAHTIQQPTGAFVVPDALADPRFTDNPLVTQNPRIRFYAGVVVRGPSGHPVGTLCVLDHQARTFGDRRCDQLRQFAALVENEIRHVYDIDRIKASIEFSAYYDPTTHLPNRRLFMDRLAKLIDLCDRDNRRITLLLFNVKALRLVNQAYGTDTGDKLLGQVGDRLRDFCPPGGTVARLQADEFILAVPSGDTAETEQVDSLAERVQERLHQPYFIDDREHYLDIRIGGSLFPDHGVSAAGLIERAATAIHAHGDYGAHGSVHIVTHAETVGLSREVEIESRLRGAIEKGAFRLEYQPVSAVDDGRITSLEALLRWHDTELGELSPAQFIPIAERSHTIIPLGRWVLAEACRQLAQWRGNGERCLPVAINVSGVQLQDRAFATSVLAELAGAGLEPELLHLEVTEFSLVSDSHHVRSNLGNLADAGVNLYIDDFGTGYSSLSYLRRMPITGLKIDRSFIAGIPDGRQDAALVRTIIGMAASLGFHTVAEGVEQAGQLDFLRAEHCAFAQGFLLGRPMSAKSIAELPDYLPLPYDETTPDSRPSGP